MSRRSKRSDCMREQEGRCRAVLGRAVLCWVVPYCAVAVPSFLFVFQKSRRPPPPASPCKAEKTGGGKTPPKKDSAKCKKPKTKSKEIFPFVIIRFHQIIHWSWSSYHQHRWGRMLNCGRCRSRYASRHRSREKKQGRSKSKSKSRKAERERKSKLSLLDAESLARWWSSFLFVLVLSFVSSFIIGRHRCPEVAIVIDPFKPIRSLGGRSCIVHRPSRLPCDSSTCIRPRLRRL